MTKKSPRNMTIEALRLIAVVGIAVFHTFQWTFENVCTGTPGLERLAVFPYSGILGFINLLGCWANEVFFMISGFFLIPSAVRTLEQGGTLKQLTNKSLSRVKKVVLPVLFYCAACLLISMFVHPLPGISIHEIGWLTLGIEFIWVYACSVLLVPAIALARERIGSQRAPFVVAPLVLATFVINLYIASTASQSTGIVSWRKLMSAATYLVSFIASSEMRFVLERHERAAIAKRSKVVITGLVAALIVFELSLSAASQLETLWMLSYKSTSAISFILAAASVCMAALNPSQEKSSTVDHAVTVLAAGTLGFYTAQSFTCNVWRPIFNDAISAVLTGDQAAAPNPMGAILLGTLLSICLALVLLTADIARRTVAHAIGEHINALGQFPSSANH